MLTLASGTTVAQLLYALAEALGHALRDRPEMRGKVRLWQIGFVEPGTER